MTDENAPNTYQISKLEWSDLGSGWKQAVVRVERGETADNPTSTKPWKRLLGPSLVTYEQAPDGGIRVLVQDLPPKPRFTDEEKESLRRQNAAIGDALL
jgi:hypothetical protein